MFLIFPRSMIILEILEHLEDANFEDWLTAALTRTRTSNRQTTRAPTVLSIRQVVVLISGCYKSQSGMGRSGQANFRWNSIKKTESFRPALAGWKTDLGEFCFALDTHSAEITFGSKALQKQIRD